ncbi:MAG: universal stress protein UspA [Rhodospirillales bacterium 20-60-12]|nr:MAG: universal stress protein UspA [Rhodospirillales bacterium 20-60-12]HQT67324.1 universal stress protein [Acetobacteraceae bacterium]HQU01051.1 universal stress protein [Acetobacteraceae bacterium]
MAIRKLLLPLISSASGEAALATALDLATIWQAHVYALHIRADTRDIAPLAGEGLSGAMIEEMMTTTEKEGSSQARSLLALFERETALRGIPVGTPPSLSEGGVRAAGALFSSVIGREDELVASEARLADLTIVPHPQSGEDVAAADALHAVLFDSGRPALIAPLVKPASIGTRIAIAWNGTGESASAVASVLPWLSRAKAVRILASDDYQRRGPTADRLAEFLRLHGIAADIVMFRPIDRSVGAGLLGAAAEFDADLMSMGAYSHSRLRQLILGGVTRHVLESAKLPVLMNR